MFQMRWAIVPACLTFGPIFLVMGVAGDASLFVAGVMMTVAGLGILFHGLFTRQLPDLGSRPSREYLSGVVTGVGLGCMAAAAFVHDPSVEWLLYVGLAIFCASSLMRPRPETQPNASSGPA